MDIFHLTIPSWLRRVASIYFIAKPLRQRWCQRFGCYQFLSFVSFLFLPTWRLQTKTCDVVDSLRYKFVYFGHDVDETFGYQIRYMYFVCHAHPVCQQILRKKNTENVRIRLFSERSEAKSSWCDIDGDAGSTIKSHEKNHVYEQQIHP